MKNFKKEPLRSSNPLAPTALPLTSKVPALTGWYLYLLACEGLHLGSNALQGRLRFWDGLTGEGGS